MNYKIVTDSSSNIFNIENVDFTAIPLKIMTDQKEYQDTKDLNVEQMLEEFKKYKGNTSTICPSINEWLDAFGNADVVFGITLTSGLSKSFENARKAKQLYEEQYPNRKVFIFDSLSAGPEIALVIQKLVELIQLEKSYTEIRNTIMDYMQRTRLMFTLPNLDTLIKHEHIDARFVKNKGRVVGRASFEGKPEPLKMCRGKKNALKKLIAQMKAAGYNGGKIIIAHTQNEANSLHLIELLKEAYGNIQVELTKNAGLCSYYTQAGSILIGFEI